MIFCYIHTTFSANEPDLKRQIKSKDMGKSCLKHMDNLLRGPIKPFFSIAAPSPILIVLLLLLFSMQSEDDKLLPLTVILLEAEMHAYI